jgi:hypothetical protein
MIAHFTGEEDGLLGSQFFVEHPTIPFANVVGMVNLDMEGLGSGDVVMAGGETFGQAWDHYTATLDTARLKHITFHRDEGHAGSDNASFLRAGVPAMAFWSRGEHPFYHKYDDDARWISDTVMDAVGTRAEDFIRFLGNRDGALAFHADTTRILARCSETVNFIGFSIDAQTTVPDLASVTAAWIPYEAAGNITETLRRLTDFRFACASKNMEAASLKEALMASRGSQRGLFIGMAEVDLNVRRPAEVTTLVRQGLSVVRLLPGTTTAYKSAPTDQIEAARKAGVYALVPFDFATPSRVDYWGKQAVVNGTLRDFAAAPASIREGLLNSEAMLCLEVSETPTKEQIDAISAARERRVHLSFGSIPRERREEHAKVCIAALLNAGLTYDDVLLLTWGNLRRWVEL